MAEAHALVQPPTMVRAAGTPFCLMNRPFHQRPSLVELCVPTISRHPNILSLLASFPSDIRSQVTAHLPLDLPLLPSSQFIFDDSYWKRRALVKWKTCDPSCHGNSWKQLFFERNLADALENFDPALEDEIVLVQLMETRAKDIAEALKRNTVLNFLNLSYNTKVEDEGGRAIFDALQLNKNLQGLSLASCGLGEEAAASLGRLISSSHSPLLYLDLSANSLIGRKGGTVIKASMETGRPPIYLNLQLCGLGKDFEEFVANVITTNEKNLRSSLPRDNIFQILLF